MNTTQPTLAQPALTLTTAALLAAMAKADVDDAVARQTIVRQHTTALLADLHATAGVKTADVTLPDGTKIGTVSLSETKDSTTVANQTEFEQWVQEHPEWDHEVEVITRVRPAFLTRLLKEIAWAVVGEDENGDPIYEATHNGELVPGLRYEPSRVKTDTFTLRWAKPKAGAAQVEGVERDGEKLIRAYLKNNPITTLMPESPAGELTA